MAELWETAFIDKQLMWGLEPTRSAERARDCFVRAGVEHVLIPGVGYGRNARVFLDAGMSGNQRRIAAVLRVVCQKA
jgi:hypothetical protein